MGACDSDTALLIVRLSFALRFTPFGHVSHKVLPKGLQCPRYLTSSQSENRKDQGNSCRVLKLF